MSEVTVLKRNKLAGEENSSISVGVNSCWKAADDENI